ncbi:MAG: hypothetical protein HPY50_21115 [Firmicutes bacterium]|nr:hypothetical protein [Bacillota bacterium]
MKELFKAAVYSALLAVLGVSLVMVSPPVSMVSAEEASPDKGGPVSFMTAPAVGMSIMGSEVHQQAYLTYLVEEYTPESMSDWSAAFEERKRVAAEFPGKRLLIEKITAPGEAGAASIRVEPLTPEQLEEGLPAVPGEGREIVIKFSDGKEVKTFETKGEARTGTVTLEKGDGKDVLIYKAEKPGEIPAEIKARMELYQSFEQAVESRDASGLKSLLPKILDDYKQVTQEMDKTAEEIKKNQ